MEFKLRYVVLPLIVLVTIKNLGAEGPAPNIKNEVTRLPTNVRPLHYNLSLALEDLTNTILKGKVVISVKISESTDVIILNSMDQNITSVELNGLKTTFSLSKEDRKLNVKSPKTLQVGNAELTIGFEGSLRNDHLGCYRVSEKDAQGEVIRYYVMTQFQQREASTCFPCFDEPALKASFTVNLTIPAGLMALSNTLVDKNIKIENNTKQTITFQKTPLMSTSTLAFAVGQYDFLEYTTKQNMPIRMYTLLGKREQATFALNITREAISYFTEYLQVPLPLNEIDSIATPFPTSTVLENYGLINYHETTVLEDPRKSDQVTETTIAESICDAMSHQWFGNLVTIEWWTDLGLQEGISIFLKYMCAEKLRPQFDERTTFYAFTFQVSLNIDSDSSNLPVEFSISNSAEIDALFDEKYQICFKKAGSLLKMVYDFAGEEKFKKGLNSYIKNHQGGTAATNDLWATIEEASSISFKEIMPHWMKLPGHPLLAIESSTQYTNGTRKLEISQKRYLVDPEDKGTDNQSLWLVPIAFGKKSKPTEVFFSKTLKQQKETIYLNDIDNKEWLLLNPGIATFYRIKYTDLMYKDLMDAIKNKAILPINRAKIADDALALARSGDASITLFLDITTYMQEEEDWLIWRNVAQNFNDIYFLLLDYAPESLDAFYDFGQELTKSIIKKVHFEFPQTEDYTVKQARYWALWSAFLFKNTNYAKFALQQFQNYVNNGVKIPNDLRLLIYRCALAAGGRDTYEALLKLYHDPGVTSDEKFNTLCAFAGVNDAKLVDDMLQFSLSKEVDLYDAANILVSVSYSQVGHDKAWAFFKTNYDYFKKNLYPVDKTAFLNTIKVLIESFTEEQKVQDIQQFLHNKEIDLNEEKIRLALRTIRINTAWLQRDGESLKKYLAAGFRVPT